MSFLGWLKPRKGKKLRAPKLIGRTAHKSFKRIWDLVMDGQSRIIGVQGMAGVGKTAIMLNVYNQLLDTQSDQFDEVIWLDLQDSRTETIRLLENKKRTLIFTDGMDGHYGFEEGSHLINEILLVVNPNRENGCKLVFTRRSVDVCTRMGCEEDCIVKVELLSEIEALELFWDTVKVEGNPLPRMTDIAEEVVKECARLPLVIVAIGKKFRRKTEFEWDKLLLEMRNSPYGIVKLVKDDFPGMQTGFSYQMWEIFELCALYPKDWKIPTKELIRYFGALYWDAAEKELMFLTRYGNLNSVEVDFEGNHEWGEGIQIQLLFRGLALMRSFVFSRCDLMLKELPEEIEWGENIERASFMCNSIRTISISPKYPKLSVLFLNKNPDLCTISHYFFVHMTGLRILDLRDNLKLETLPDSISNLISLRVVRLSRCRSLKQVPSLAKILHMHMLELDETAIEELPHGIEMLVKLRVLKLHSLSLREAIPSDYLSMLCSLPHLELHL